jgi:hypothetical protein
MSKQAFKVVKMVICPHCRPEVTVVRDLLSSKVAVNLRDKLNEATLETFNPDRVVSYLVQPA